MTPEMQQHFGSDASSLGAPMMGEGEWALYKAAQEASETLGGMARYLGEPVTSEAGLHARNIQPLWELRGEYLQKMMEPFRGLSEEEIRNPAFRPDWRHMYKHSLVTPEEGLEEARRHAGAITDFTLHERDYLEELLRRAR